MICILDKPVKTWMESNFISMDTDKLNIPENLKIPFNRFINIAKDHLMFSPTISIKKDKIHIKYDHEKKYIIFTLNEKSLSYVFGVIGGKPSNPINITSLNGNMITFSNFIYK